MSDLKDYLGDGVYIDYDGYSLTMTTENGISVTNTIVLDSKVYAALLRYIERINRVKQ